MSDDQEINDEEINDVDDGVIPEEEESLEPVEPQFEDAKELTGISGGAPAWFDRKKVMMVIASALSVIVLLGLIFSSNKSDKKKQAAAESGWAANAPNDFLKRELENSLRSPPQAAEQPEEPADFYEDIPAALPMAAPEPVVIYQPPSPPPQQQSSERRPQPQLSSLVPKVEGSLFASQAPQAAPQQAADPYATLLAGIGSQGQAGGLPASLLSLLGQQDSGQAANNSLYNSGSGGAISGSFLQENLLWIGTIVPAVLETAINTDLPGNVIARVTQNIYDSQTGKNILIPQGTILVAQYNSSISYQQHRVQVVWDILIRPDGYQVELEGMNGVDPKGIAGLKAAYHENWFEYIKAAGIISLFSLINSKMVEEVAKYGSDEMAAGVITSNAEFVKDLGGNLVSRAMNIQPTLTVDSGEKISVILNKNIYLPPYKNFEVKQRYALP